MYYEKRGKGFSFIYFDSVQKKNVRLSKESHPVIQTEREAAQFCRQWSAQWDGLKSRVHKKNQLEQKYHHFEELLQFYEIDRKEESPNSWEEYVYQARTYVLPFFVKLKAENNINNWYYHFEEFREHIQKLRPLKPSMGKSTYSYSSMNGMIKSLNAFLRSMYRRRVIDRKPESCRMFNPSKLTVRSIDSVLDETTQVRIYEALQEKDSLTADFFKVSLHTGLRLNEQMGLSLADFMVGEPESEFIRCSLRPYDFTLYGYITLDSQPSLDRTDVREASGDVPRKPLKGKKQASSDDCRIVPIVDKHTFNILVGLWNQQRKLFEVKRYGTDPKNYLLFNGLSKNSYSSRLRKTQRGLKLERLFTPHDTRHTYSTWLAERTMGNYAVCRLILGHSSLEMTMRYVHLNAKLQRQLHSRVQYKEALDVAG